jgi:hypothetical protein
VPETEGNEVFVGGTAATTAVCELDALAAPAVLVPVTVRRIVLPTSAAVSV